MTASLRADEAAPIAGRRIDQRRAAALQGTVQLAVENPEWIALLRLVCDCAASSSDGIVRLESLRRLAESLRMPGPLGMGLCALAEYDLVSLPPRLGESGDEDAIGLPDRAAVERALDELAPLVHLLTADLGTSKQVQAMCEQLRRPGPGPGIEAVAS